MNKYFLFLRYFFFNVESYTRLLSILMRVRKFRVFFGKSDTSFCDVYFVISVFIIAFEIVILIGQLVNNNYPIDCVGEQRW